MKDLVARALAEDVGSGDVTTRAVVPPGATATATISQKEGGVIAGLAVARTVFATVDERLEFRQLVEEGLWREAGPVAEISGEAGSILTGERVALNFLGHLSGVATLTARYVRAVEGTGVHILDTRKTMPGLRTLEKAAVVVGGGHNHRTGLYDMVLIKENHSALGGGVGEATRKALASAPEGMDVEVECATLDEVDEALEAGATRILLDNMSSDELRQAVARVDGRARTEASGGVNLDTIREIAETGVDDISVGALTHSPAALDLSLLLDTGH